MPRRNHLTIAALTICCALRPPASTTATTRRRSTTVTETERRMEESAAIAEDTIQKMERDGFAVVETTLLTRPVLDAAHEFVMKRHATLIEAAAKRGASPTADRTISA